MAALFLFKRFLPRVPGPLIVVAAGILLVAFGGLRDAGVELITPVTRAFPLPTLPSLQHVFQLIPGALAIAVMAFLESAAVARGIRDLDDPRFDEMPERGALRGWSQAAIMDLLRSCEGAGLIEASRGEYPTISTTRKGDQVGIGTLDPNDLGLQMPTMKKKPNQEKKMARKSPTGERPHV